MNKKELDMLEKVYDLEIDDRIYQGKSKIVKTLMDSGHLQAIAYTLPGNKQCPFPIEIKGFGLTHIGREAYCSSDRCK